MPLHKFSGTLISLNNLNLLMIPKAQLLISSVAALSHPCLCVWKGGKV